MKKIFPLLAIFLSAGIALSGCQKNNKKPTGHCSGNTCTVGRNINEAK